MTRPTRRISSGPVVIAIVLLALSATNGCAEGEETVLEIPFELVHDQVLLTATIGRHGPYNVVLDTAATPFDARSVDGSRGRYSDAPRSHRNCHRSGQRNGSHSPAWLTGLELGGRRFGGFLSVAMDTSALSHRLERKLDGILGNSFLKNRVIQIDYPRRVVRIFPDDRWPPPRNPNDVSNLYETTLEFAPGDVAPLLRDFRVNGRQVPVTLDTGSSLTLELYPHAIAELKLESKVDSDTQLTMVGARAEESLSKTVVDSLGIGPLTRTHAEVEVAPRTDRHRSAGATWETAFSAATC